jgi:hypothetical protein
MIDFGFEIWFLVPISFTSSIRVLGLARALLASIGGRITVPNDLRTVADMQVRNDGSI